MNTQRKEHHLDKQALAERLKPRLLIKGLNQTTEDKAKQRNKLLDNIILIVSEVHNLTNWPFPIIPSSISR